MISPRFFELIGEPRGGEGLHCGAASSDQYGINPAEEEAWREGAVEDLYVLVIQHSSPALFFCFLLFSSS